MDNLGDKLTEVFKKAIKDAEEKVKQYGLSLPSMPPEEYYVEVGRFPEDITELPDNELMSLWNKTSRIEEYAEYLYTRENLLCKYLKVAKERAYIDAKMKENSNKKWVAEDMALLDEDYTEIEKTLLRHESIRDLLNQSLKMYRKYTSFCSRDLTRRQGTLESKHVKDGFHRYIG